MDWLAYADRLIREGRSDLARRELERNLVGFDPLSPQGRPHVPAVARLCRRAQLGAVALRLLNPIVRAEKTLAIRSTPEEVLEYGATLIQIGADREGSRLLLQLDPQEFPQVLLFRAFAAFGLRDHEAAIPLLEQYLIHPLSDYQRLVAQMNLADALAQSGRFDDAARLCEELLPRTDATSSQLMHANLHRVLGFVALHTGQPGEARRQFIRTREHLQDTGCRDYFITTVLEFLATLSLDPPSRDAIEERLRGVRQQSAATGEWEILRDFDLHWAGCGGPAALYPRLYFGTPWPSFRKKVAAASGLSFADLPGYQWVLGGETPAGGPKFRLDVMTGESEGGTRPSVLKCGQIPQRLLALLASDFYRPQRLAEIHDELFPGRFYNPLTSPDVIYQALHRLRRWFVEHGLPLRIEERHGLYSLASEAPCELHIPAENLRRAHGSRIDELVLALQRFLKPCGSDSAKPCGKDASPAASGDLFSAQTAATFWKVSVRSASRFLKEACDRELMERVSSGPNTRYRFKS